ncbi:Zn(II)2Cys6 transcription factor [Phyllosticta capitalensis]|uniref:Zn(II)2Cys6 transcription factor n=2 Tax=Phyllosticta capitalensis TaxID=121624 RepID=A0ABR1YDT1_9PEZI
MDDAAVAPRLFPTLFHHHHHRPTSPHAPDRGTLTCLLFFMQQPPLARQSCGRCYGKKIKCSRELPICTPCRRSGQTCSYEKRQRTPLTRKYLTEVENQLAEARALVQQYASASGSANGSVEPEAVRRDTVVQDGPSPLSSPLDREQSAQCSNEPVRRRTIPVSLEQTPASSSGNLEWDERLLSRKSLRRADGMANLPEENEGYLGIASGTNFLHLTELSQLAHPSNGDSRASPAPPTLQMPLPSQLDQYLDDYFALYHPSYPIIHEPTFRAEYMEVVPRPSDSLWHVLLYVVSALGACSSGNAPLGTHVTLFEFAKSRLTIDILETGNMLLVQILALMANYVQKANKPNSGYNYLGLAKRMAVGIGLHREYPEWSVKPWQVEMRRRVWWCLIIFDIGASITFSRPIELPNGVNIGLPRNFRDSDLTKATNTFPAEAPETTVYTNIHHQATFDFAIQNIYTVLMTGIWPNPDTTIKMDDEWIGQWLASLPPYFREDALQAPKFRLAHAILRWRYRNFRIIIYRPFLVRRIVQSRRRSDHESDDAYNDPAITAAIKRCHHAARETIDLISEFWNEQRKSAMACWYGIFFLFQAVLVPLIALRNEPDSEHADDWGQQVQKAVAVLEDMAQMNSTASRCLRVIQTEASPQTQLNHFNSLLWPYDAANLDEGGAPVEYFNQMPGFPWDLT